MTAGIRCRIISDEVSDGTIFLLLELCCFFFFHLFSYLSLVPILRPVAVVIRIALLGHPLLVLRYLSSPCIHTSSLPDIIHLLSLKHCYHIIVLPPLSPSPLASPPLSAFAPPILIGPPSQQRPSHQPPYTSVPALSHFRGDLSTR